MAIGRLGGPDRGSGDRLALCDHDERDSIQGHRHAGRLAGELDHGASRLGRYALR